MLHHNPDNPNCPDNDPENGIIHTIPCSCEDDGAALSDHFVATERITEALEYIDTLGMQVRAAGDPDDLLTLTKRGLVVIEPKR